MGKKGSSSWLTAVKRAFRSPSKDTHKKSSRRREDDHEVEQDDDKKREKRRWLFRKATTTSNVVVHQSEANPKTSYVSQANANDVELAGAAQAKHAITVAAATAKAAVATAEIIRLTTRPSSIFVKLHIAAILIQTAFRAYLGAQSWLVKARRALRGLKGIVTLQALIRGQNVRKQATITLRCMQALIRVQARLHDQRSRLSHDGGRKSMFAETANLWESKYLQEIRHRKSISRDGNCSADDWSEIPRTLEELDTILQSRKEAGFTRENSQQIWKSSINPSSGDDEKELEERANWLDRWMAAKQWECQRSSRASFDTRESIIKTVEIDKSRPYSRSSKSLYHAPHNYIPNNSPRQRATYNNPSIIQAQQPVTPSPSKTKLPLHVRSASPRCLKEDRSYFANIQQSSRSTTPRFNGIMCRYSTCANDVATPNYMAATESAKARIRSQSVPRQRPSTPERERERPGSAKKRLAYPSVLPDPSCDDSSDKANNYCSFSHNLRSPSFKSVQVGHVGMGQQYSCYTDSTGGEISPCSTTDLRRWLR